MDGDRPIKTRESDRLGFAPVAEHLARAILDQPAKDGLVFGIEGKWGSGKSTLIGLTIEALKRHSDTAPEIIEFSPWLVGDRDGLIVSLFGELLNAVVKIDPVDDAVTEANLSLWGRLQRFLTPDKHWTLKQKERLRKQLGGKLRAFGAMSVPLGKLAKAAGVVGIPAADLAGTLIERSGDAAKSLFGDASTAKRKSELVDALRLLSRRIVVFVDDLDRLEPRETTEILRLIRAVADFPNVIYVLSYDRDVVARTLTEAVRVGDGAVFLEKIVQVSFRVPRPEAFDLRRWFQTEVEALFADEIKSSGVGRDSGAQRLAQVVDIRGGRYLRTPRDVVRALNALRLHGVPVRALIDIPDMVWLQLVKIGNPKLFEWVEQYLNEVAAIANGAIVSTAESQLMQNRLNEILAAEKVDADREWFELRDILPGTEDDQWLPTTGEKPRVFNNIKERIKPFVANKRLGSPQHYRHYFAFSAPAGALSDDQVQGFVSNAENDPKQASAMFADWARTVRPQGGSMAEVLIDHLIAKSKKIPDEAITGVIASLADHMDEPALCSEGVDLGRPRAWWLAENALEILLKRTKNENRSVCLRMLFSDGKALGWLTSVLRNEIFSHGHFGDRAEPESQRLLSPREFEIALNMMLDRYRNAPAEQLLRAPDLMNLLYCWKQGRGTDEARKWVEARIATEAGLLSLLSRVRGWVNSSEHGTYYPLKRRDLEQFLDYDDAHRRVQDIASSADTSAEDRQLAQELLVAFKQDRDLDADTDE